MIYELNQISRFCNFSCVSYSSIWWIEKVGGIDMMVDGVGVCIVDIDIGIPFF